MKVLIIDDHYLYLEGVRAILSTLFPGSCSLSAHKIDDAFDLLVLHDDVDIILLDVCMPNGGAPAVLKRLQQHGYAIPVLVVSASENSADVKMAINLGALGYLPKSSTPSELKKAIEHILQGNEYLPDGWHDTLINSSNITVNDGGEKISISPRLYEVLQLIDKGYTAPEISDLLGLSKHTVKDYIKDLFLRFDVHNRTELIQTAHQLHFFNLRR